MAIRRRQLHPRGLSSWHVAATTGGLLAYWALRLLLQYGLGIPAFPSG
jgi:hypothetical protein